MEDLLEKNHVICRTYDSVGISGLYGAVKTARERLMPLVYDFCRRKYESAEDIEKRCQEFLDEHFDDMQMILQNEFLEIAANSKYDIVCSVKYNHVGLSLELRKNIVAIMDEDVAPVFLKPEIPLFKVKTKDVSALKSTSKTIGLLERIMIIDPAIEYSKQYYHWEYHFKERIKELILEEVVLLGDEKIDKGRPGPKRKED